METVMGAQLLLLWPLWFIQNSTAEAERDGGGEEAEDDNTFSDDVVSLFAAARLCRKVSINHFWKAVYVFNTVSAQRFK